MYAASSKATAEKTTLDSSLSWDETNRGREQQAVKRGIFPAETGNSSNASKKRKAAVPLRSEFAKEWEAQVQWNKAQQPRASPAMATMSEHPPKPTGSYPTPQYNMNLPNHGFAGFMNQLNMYGQQQQAFLNPQYQLTNSMQQAMTNAVHSSGTVPMSPGMPSGQAHKMQHDQVSLTALPMLYKQEIEAYRALVVSTREREQHIKWLETRLKEHGLVDANQPSALSASMPMFPGQLSAMDSHRMLQSHSSSPLCEQRLVKTGVKRASSASAKMSSEGTKVQQGLSGSSSARGQSFSTRDYLRGDDTPDLIHDKKVGRVSFVQPGSVPTFIQEELKNAPGNGQFTICELMITLCFAHQLLFHRNTYSTIKKRMLNKRSRASIRRKIEKIVFKETGIDGGLLLAPEEKRIQILSCLWSRFAKLIDEAIVYGSPALESFSKKLRNYANVANATEENVKSGTAWVIKEPKAK